MYSYIFTYNISRTHKKLLTVDTFKVKIYMGDLFFIVYNKIFYIQFKFF